MQRGVRVGGSVGKKHGSHPRVVVKETAVIKDTRQFMVQLGGSGGSSRPHTWPG